MSCDISLWFWFAFIWLLAVLIIFSWVFLPSVCLLWQNGNSDFLPVLKFDNFISDIEFLWIVYIFWMLWMLFSCPVMSDSLWPMDCSTPGLPVSPHLPKFAQVHVHCIGDAIWPSHPLTPFSLSALHLSQHLIFWILAPNCHIIWKYFLRFSRWTFHFVSGFLCSISGL